MFTVRAVVNSEIIVHKFSTLAHAEMWLNTSRANFEGGFFEIV